MAKVDDPLAAVLEPALKVGAFTGGAGFLVGGTAGILRSTTPALFATASAIQTFALGTTFWGTRGIILQTWATSKQRTSSDLTKASALAGVVSGGAVGAITRGRFNALPGAIMIGLFGGIGQIMYNSTNAPKATNAETRPGFWKRMSEKGWSPMRMMTNEEYAEMLREKMLKVDVEISILDDKIAALRKQQEDEAANADVGDPTPSPK